MIAVVTVRGTTAGALQSAALDKAAPLWNCHLDNHVWYLEGAYSWRLAVMDEDIEAHLVVTDPPGDQLHQHGKQWEATIRVWTVRA